MYREGKARRRGYAVARDTRYVRGLRVGLRRVINPGLNDSYRHL